VRRLTEKQKIDYVDVVIAIPKAVMDFLEANKKSLEYTSVEAYINQFRLVMPPPPPDPPPPGPGIHQLRCTPDG
jgi:hypothetical protein